MPQTASSHLLVAISSHGFGHVAQVAPVLNAMRRRHPAMRLTLRSAAPAALLASRIDCPFEVQPVADDFGMVQHSALAIDVAASTARYREFHREWETRVASVARALEAVRPDVILADVPYLTLAAAARVGIPALALCSLNWADIFHHYCADTEDAAAIHGEMLAAYRSAVAFLRPAPSMPMPDLPNARAIGPIAAVGNDRRAELAARFGIGREERLVLVSLGGIATRLPAERWPRLAGVRWIFQRDWGVVRDDALVFEELGLGFSDLLASCDLLLTKPGYGSFVEAAAVGVPVLYVERADWPETACLTEWLHRHGNALALTVAEAASGDFAQKLSILLTDGRFAPVPTTGAEEVVDTLTALRR